jgi:hypothetical protein
MRPWPELSHATLRPTTDTLQLWTQIVGKVRLARAPWLNHSWHVPLYVSARGLATSLIPGDDHGLDMEFDFVAQHLVIRVVGGGEKRIPLTAGSVAGFHVAVLEALAALGAPTRIDALPSEMPDPIPFDRDTATRPYDPAVARSFWLALVRIDAVFNRFRSGFIGKNSPVHFFWGGFDLAVTRFSGRRAPRHPGGIPHLSDAVTREAYSHEVSSAGFWPGGMGVDAPSFYSYAYPTPPGFAAAKVSPEAARFDAGLGEFLLPYDAVRTDADPDGVLMSFLRSTYAAAADLGHWDRAELECEEGHPGRPRPVG